MSTKTYESSLLDSIEVAFNQRKHDTAEHLVRALISLTSRTDSEKKALYGSILRLPSANPVMGFFPYELSMREDYLPIDSKRSGLTQIDSMHSRIPHKVMSGEIGYGPSLFECRVRYDRRAFSYRDDSDERKLHIRTVFYYEGDKRFPQGNYFRTYERGHGSRFGREPLFNVFVQPDGKWIDPLCLPVDSLYGYMLREPREDTSMAVPGLVNAFMAAFNKDIN